MNTLTNLYPTAQGGLYPEQSSVQQADNPMPVRFANIDQIMAAANSSAEIPLAIEQMTAVLRERHRLRAGEPDDFNIRDMAELTHTLSTTTKLMTNLLLAVAMISLVVGGVGIMNIMLVSVTERTREIGLRMAVGARGKDILRQFLVEAVVLCLTGGAMGIVLGHGGSLLVRFLLRWPVETSPPPSPRRCWFRPGWASSSDSTRPGRPRGWTPSRRCAMNNDGAPNDELFHRRGANFYLLFQCVLFASLCLGVTSFWLLRVRHE